MVIQIYKQVHGVCTMYYMFVAYHVAQKLPGGGKNQQVCDFDQPPQNGKVCEVNVKNFQPCTMDMGYGFNRSSPCIFIKLNKVCNICTCYFYSSTSLLYLFVKEHNHLIQQIGTF